MCTMSEPDPPHDIVDDILGLLSNSRGNLNAVYKIKDIKDRYIKGASNKQHRTEIQGLVNKALFVARRRAREMGGITELLLLFWWDEKHDNIVYILTRKKFGSLVCNQVGDGEIDVVGNWMYAGWDTREGEITPSLKDWQKSIIQHELEGGAKKKKNKKVEKVQEGSPPKRGGKKRRNNRRRGKNGLDSNLGQAQDQPT